MKLPASNFQLSNFSINCNGRLVDLNTPKIMGILNLTPDSFSDGGKFNNEKSALLHAEKLLKDGADFIDIGAQSTRPNAEYLSAEEEIRRIGTVISLIKKEFPETLISLDTFYAEVVKFGYKHKGERVWTQSNQSRKSRPRSMYPVS
jgi:dihydropteroate synthase